MITLVDNIFDIGIQPKILSKTARVKHALKSS